MHKKISFTKKPLDQLSADVLFNYANTDFIPIKGGVYETILSLDSAIARECANSHLRKPGTAVLLSAGKLPFKDICHFAISGTGNDPTEMSIRSAMRWGFQLASERRYPTYVLPTLYTETGGMPYELCAEIVLREILIFAESKFVEKIVIQARGPKEYSQYTAVFKTLTVKK